ncbi:MAG: TetR/AcrR family transcriptional regulator [Anaerolineales bacterium]|nr:TetR/AcrR family transcriptional regulator [Anaerolineales bacterium]
MSAAEALFLEKLYADVSMRELADRAGVTTGALYYHYPSKAELYYEMLRADFAEKRRLLKGVVDRRASAYGNLESLLRAFVTIPAEKRDLMHLVRRDINAFRDPMRREIIAIYQRSLPDIIAWVVHQGVKRGELRPGDPTLIARQLIGLLEVALAPYGVRELGGEGAVVDQVMEMFWRGAGNGEPSVGVEGASSSSG